MEGCLRLMGVSYPSFYTYDTATGAALRPNAEGRWLKEGKSYVKINKDGLNDREHSQQKPDSVIRIAVLGDFYAEAFQVPREKAFWSVLESRMNDKICPALNGKQVEVINFGVSGFGTAQELKMLRSRVWRYKPDIVLLAFTTGNDVRNNHPELEKSSYKPYFYYSDDDLVLDDSFLESSGFRLRISWIGRIRYFFIDRSRVLQLVIHVKNQMTASRQVDQTGQHQYLGEAGLDSAIYKAPETTEWKEAWRVTEGLLRLINEEVSAKGAEFLLMPLSNSIQVNPDADVRKSFIRQLGINDLIYPDNRLRDFAAAEGIEHLILAPGLQQWAETESVCIHGFENAARCSGHWNEIGHRLAAGIRAANAVCKLVSGTTVNV